MKLADKNFSQRIMEEWRDYSCLVSNKLPKVKTTVANLLITILVVIICVLTFVPWQQYSYGVGQMTALSPESRVQPINSFVSGRINKWYVQEGESLKKGDPVVQIIDNDPNFLLRLEEEKNAAFSKYDVSKQARETAYLNVQRQEELFKKGFSSKKALESAQIYYKKLLATEAEAKAKLAKVEINLARQAMQVLEAPQDGTILRIVSGSISTQVKKGDILAIFVPNEVDMAAELYVDGNDIPLIYPGRRVSLQFEGWPSLQILGWPSLAVGLFQGVVHKVDTSIQKHGKFRVLVVPGEHQWPNQRFLRQETFVQGWVLLNEVKLGHEVWRQVNNFPPYIEKEIIEQAQEEMKVLTK